jgi:copper(I)-binding protein
MLRLALCLGLLLGLTTPAVAGDIEVRDAWIRQPPPGANAAAYMTIANAGESARRLVAVRSDVADRLELHRTTVENGVARMTRVEEVELPAGAEVALAPRGLHLMLIKPKSLSEGDSIELTLELDGGEVLAVTVAVRKHAAGAGDHAGHH